METFVRSHSIICIRSRHIIWGYIEDSPLGSPSVSSSQYPLRQFGWGQNLNSPVSSQHSFSVSQ